MCSARLASITYWGHVSLLHHGCLAGQASQTLTEYPRGAGGIEGEYSVVSRSVSTKHYSDPQSVKRDHDEEETAGPYLPF